MNVQPIDKKGAILEATLDLINEKGFHGITMSMIWKRAGVAAGTIYHYFQIKEELIDELYAITKLEMGKALVSQQPGGTYYEQFEEYWRGLYHYFICNPKHFLFLEQYANSPYISQKTREENQRHYMSVIEFLSKGVDCGILRPLPVVLVTSLIYGAMTSIVKLHLSEELRIDECLLDP